MGKVISIGRRFKIKIDGEIVGTVEDTDITLESEEFGESYGASCELCGERTTNVCNCGSVICTSCMRTHMKRCPKWRNE